MPILCKIFLKKKCVIEDNEMVDDVDNPAPISSNQPMKNLEIYVISNQNKGTIENIIIDIGIVLSSKTTIDDFTKNQLLENHWKPPIGYNFPYSSDTKNGILR